ncbi:hypothetical protein BJX76DRAFT_183155 [Aspergillus varians]
MERFCTVILITVLVLSHYIHDARCRNYLGKAWLETQPGPSNSCPTRSSHHIHRTVHTYKIQSISSQASTGWPAGVQPGCGWATLLRDRS